MLKAYKYRIYPDKDQAETLRRYFGSCRYVYNWALDTKKKAHEAGEKSLSWQSLCKKLTPHKQENLWLYETPNASLQFSIRHLDTAYKNFFRRVKAGAEEPGFPKFKSRHNYPHSFQVISNYHVNYDSQTIKLPKINTLIRAVIDRPLPEGVKKTATVSLTSTGKFYISVLVDDGKDLPETESFDENSTVGIDVGISSFATLSNGVKIPSPRHLLNSEKRLACLQRRLSRKKLGSKNRHKAKIKVARIHEKIANQRQDFLHKLSYTLVRENQAIAVEDLNIKGMQKNKHLAKSVSDQGWGEFIRMLTYKSEFYGKSLLKIDRFDPSSKLCSVCGYKNDGLKLSDRKWVCPDCSTAHDRDHNAAINIKKLALANYSGQKLSGEPVDSSRRRGNEAGTSGAT